MRIISDAIKAGDIHWPFKPIPKYKSGGVVGPPAMIGNNDDPEVVQLPNPNGLILVPDNWKPGDVVTPPPFPDRIYPVFKPGVKTEPVNYDLTKGYGIDVIKKAIAQLKSANYKPSYIEGVKIGIHFGMDLSLHTWQPEIKPMAFEPDLSYMRPGGEFRMERRPFIYGMDYGFNIATPEIIHYANPDRMYGESRIPHITILLAMLYWRSIVLMHMEKNEYAAHVLYEDYKFRTILLLFSHGWLKVPVKMFYHYSGWLSKRPVTLRWLPVKNRVDGILLYQDGKFFQ